MMDGRLFNELLGSTVLGGLFVFLGPVFLVAQERSKATVGLALAWLTSGLTLMTSPLLVDRVTPGDVTLVERLQVLIEASAVVTSVVYLSGLLATAQPSPRARILVRTLVRTGYALAAALAVLGLVFPDRRLNDYTMGLGDSGVLGRPGYWLFAAVWLLVMAVFSLAFAVLARQQIDQGEHVRLITNVISAPLLVLSTTLPYKLAILSFFLAAVVVLFGLFRFFAAQGERGVFLSRFMSPQVFEMVRMEGLGAVTRARELDITVVCCDLRGFTAYAEAVPSQSVIDLLGEYYDSIGDAVAEVDGTIKDFAGDGILVLVGAPLTRPDHAAVGLALASLIIKVGHQVTEHWGTRPHPLGLGVGVASGRVTVGGVGSTGRTEYTAVGAPVNLAARLCSAAADGEILVDERTAELTGINGLEPRGEMQLKGLSYEVAVFAVPVRQI
jgi:class 3 adenylate cyclase